MGAARPPELDPAYTGATLLVATGNDDKLREIRQILDFTGFRLVGLADLDPAPEEPDEPFDSFSANAAHKARHYARAAGRPTLADDSGIRVHALGGAPGVHSKRFSGQADLSGQALDDENNRTLLRRLDGVPDDARAAHYVCAAVLAMPDGSIRATTIGTCAGRILATPRGTGGFGYDPLFLIPRLGRTFGEMSADEKNRMSHRARAFRALAPLVHRLIRGD